MPYMLWPSQMLVLIVIALLAAAVKGALVALDAWSLRRIEANEVLSREDVEEIIEDALAYLMDRRWRRLDWHRFIHARFRDPQLESIRQRCAKFGDHFPFDRGEHEGRESDYQGMEASLESMLEELRAMAAPGVRQRRLRPDADKATFEDGYSRSHANGVILWVAEHQLSTGTRWYIEVARPHVWPGGTQMLLDLTIDDCHQTLDGATTRADELSGCPQPCSCPEWGHVQRPAEMTIGAA
jgi:hypothetical protein